MLSISKLHKNKNKLQSLYTSLNLVHKAMDKVETGTSNQKISWLLEQETKIYKLISIAIKSSIN